MDIKEIDMEKSIKLIIALLIVLLIAQPTFAGNEQRVSQAGASELLINPWARSSGLGDASIANITGVESIFGNIAGSVRINKTQVAFCNTKWISGWDVNVNAFALTQRVGDAGAISLSVSMLDWGELNTTTVDLPDGDGTKFQPRYTTIGVSYAKEFSNSIFGGVTVKLINESISNLHGNGVAFDAGIQYITGIDEQIKFGVTMKNVGPTMKLNGDGMAISANYEEGPIMTMQIRPDAFELPSLIKLGASYDFKLSADHGITVMAAFTENSFSKNQYHGGLEYSFKSLFMVRGGYIYENGITDDVERSTVFTGWSAGFSLDVPIKKGSDKKFAIDYSYRDTDPFKGVHSIGVKITL